MEGKNPNVLTLGVVFFLLPSTLMVFGGFPPCEDYDYSPCECQLYESTFNNISQRYIDCFNVTGEEVRDVFSQIPAFDLETVSIYLAPPRNPEDEVSEIPADLLSQSRALTILIFCWSNDSPLRFDLDTFRSTKLSTIQFEMYYCNMNGTTFEFLQGFDNLRDLDFMADDDLPSSMETLPPLPGLSRIFLDSCPGLNDADQWARFPILSNGLTALHTYYLGLEDPAVDASFDWLLKSSADTLSTVYLSGDHLTRIPPEIANFTNLDDFEIMFNSDPMMIPEGSIVSTEEHPIHWLELSFSHIYKIEPGAFEGDFGEAEVNLGNNELTRFEAEVFQPILEQMSKQHIRPGHVIIGSNPIDCKEDLCHLAWLIRDRRELLDFVDDDASCSNGTNFNKLLEEGFNDCPYLETTVELASTVSTSTESTTTKSTSTESNTQSTSTESATTKSTSTESTTTTDDSGASLNGLQMDFFKALLYFSIFLMQLYFSSF